MRTFVIIVVLALLAVGSFFLIRELEKQTTEVVKTLPTRKIATAYQVSVIYYDDQRRRRYQLVSDEVSEYSNSAGKRFTKPEVTAFDEQNEISWLGKAEKGHLASGKQKLTLSERVNAIDSPNAKRPIYIEGSLMYYYPQKYELSSDRLVTIGDKVSRQQSDGFLLNTKTKQLAVSDRVRARFAVSGSADTKDKKDK